MVVRALFGRNISGCDCTVDISLPESIIPFDRIRILRVHRSNSSLLESRIMDKKLDIVWPSERVTAEGKPH
jgi:hypothetical protein